MRGIRYETERVRAEAAHHRQLAAAQAERAEALSTTNAILHRLGQIGQEITNQLELEAILSTLDRHVHELLDATCFAIYLVDADGYGLTSARFVECGRPQPVDRMPLDSPVRHAARCVRERTEILLDAATGDGDPSHVPGTLDTASALFTPLLIGDRAIGLMTIQSLHRHAYGERERLIFRTLCAYGAIALDNASAYRQLAQAEAGLRASERRYQRVVSNISDALIVQDIDGRIVFANARFFALHGIVPQDPQLLRWEDHVAEAHRATIRAWHAVDREQPAQYEYEAQREDGSRVWLDARRTPVYEDGALAGTQSAIRNVTERKRAEQEIERALRQEQELGQLRTRFVSMTSHEFRTPLAGILSSIQLLRHYETRLPPDEKAELYGQIEQSIARMTEMLDNVLLIGRNDAKGLQFRPARTDVEALCRELADEIERLPQHGAQRATLSLSLQGLGEYIVDPALLRHILGNLLSNAIKYSPQGGEVRFESRRTGQGLHFVVSDQGIGIPLEDQAHLFESFHRASNVGRIAGTGLGLAIVKQSVDLHGGTIAIDSAPGRGSRFRVEIPVGE